MKFKILSASIALLMMASLTLAAQTFQVKASFKDKETGESIEFATVSITAKDAKTPAAYALTDDKGSVAIKGLKAGTYTVKSELMGYKTYSQEITIKDKAIDLGEVKMDIDVNTLESATITSVGNPIVVKKDTVEYNASSFKTTDNDMLEDLLKKLPGVEVSSDGTVTANGKTISKITVDGNTFFLNDPQLSTKNLPAKIIEKVKILEKKSDQSLFTGIDDGNTETIIDLSIYQGMKNGWFGNVTAGGGLDLKPVDKGDDFFGENKARYTGNVMVGRFQNNGQVAIVGNANNANNMGFNNMVGSMMRTGRGGGGMNGGINSSYTVGGTAGLRFGANNKSEISGTFATNGSNSYSEEGTYKITLRDANSTLLSDDQSIGTSRTSGNSIGGKLDWYISDNTSIVFEPQVSFGKGGFDESSKFLTANGDGNQNQLNKINDGGKHNYGDNNSLSTSGRFLIRQRFAKPGRTLSLNVQYSLSNNNTNGYNYTLTNVYNEQDSLTETNIVDQFYNQISRNQNINTRLSYTDHIGGSYFLELTYSYSHMNNNSNKDTFDKDADGKYTVKDEKYSNEVVNINSNHNAGINLMRQDDNLSMTIGASIQPYSTKSTTRMNGKTTTINQHEINWSPNARIEYDFNNTTTLRLTYNGRTSQPSVNQLNPVEDNTNPLRITRGNPDLTQTFSHNVNVNFFRNNRSTFSSMNASLGFTYNKNNIVNGTWTTKQGVTYSVPMNNRKGTFSANGRFMVNVPIAKSNFSIMSETSGNYSKSMSFVGKENIIDGDDPASYLNMDNYEENQYTNISVSQQLRFTYRGDQFEATLGGNARYNKSFYQRSYSDVKANWNNSVNASLNWDSKNGFEISTDARYNFYFGMSSGYNEPNLVWNASVSQQLFKRTATLSLRVTDILNQQRNKSRNISDNYITDSRRLTLGRYVMLSFTYRFGTFGRGRGGMGGRGGGMPARNITRTNNNNNAQAQNAQQGNDQQQQNSQQQQNGQQGRPTPPQSGPGMGGPGGMPMPPMGGGRGGRP